MKIINLSVLVVLLCSTSVFAVAPQKDQPVAKNSIYASCGLYLFEQDSVVDTQAFKDATMKAKGDMLEAEFNSRRRWCYAIELGKITLTLVPTSVLFYHGYHRFIANNNAAIGVGGGFMMYGVFNVFGSAISEISAFVRDKVDSARSVSYNILYPTGNDSIEKYEIHYVRQKPFINKGLQEILEQNFITARVGDKNENMMFSSSSSKERPSPVEFARNVLALPTTKIQVDYNPARIDASLGSFDKTVLSQFKRFAVRHAAASTGDTVKKIVAYLEGPPGVGKTFAAERIADTLEVPFYVIKLGGKSIADLEGTSSAPGLILEALLKAKYQGRGAKNMIIFFDEIDRALGMTPPEESERKPMDSGMSSGKRRYSDSALIPFLLTLLEPSQKTFYSPYLGIDVDISSIGFIGAGNFKITDAALLSRFEVVPFEGYNFDFKRNVVESRIFGELLKPFEDSKLSLTRRDFSKEDWQMIGDMIKADKDPGFRAIITNLQNFMSDKVLCKHYNECEYRAKSEVAVAPVCKARKWNNSSLVDQQPQF